jgi:hypothetical protein
VDLEEFMYSTGLKLGSIAAEPSGTYGQDAYERPSIKYGMHQLKLSRTDLTTEHLGGRPALDDIDAEVASFRSNWPLLRSV